MRGQTLRYDTDRMTFGFTMLNDDGKTVQCQVSAAAMDELAGARGTLPAEREAQFLDLRETIERIASDSFDHGPTVSGAVIRIFAKHIRNARHSSGPNNGRR